MDYLKIYSGNLIVMNIYDRISICIYHKISSIGYLSTYLSIFF